jgi:hypothetical protein
MIITYDDDDDDVDGIRHFFIIVTVHVADSMALYLRRWLSSKKHSIVRFDVLIVV